MKRLRVISVALGIAIIGIVLILRRDTPAGNEPPATVQEADALAVAAQPAIPDAIAAEPEIQAAAPGAEATPEDTPEKSRAGFASISGKVIFPEDAPKGLAVTVSLHTADLSGPPDQVTELTRMQAGAEGAYKFNDLPLGQYVVYAEAEGFIGDANVYITDYERNAWDAWTFLTPSGTLSGRVVNEAREPIPDAQVFVVEQYIDGFKVATTPERSYASRQITGEDGRFAMPRLRRLFNGEPGYRLGVKAEGYAPYVSDFVQPGKQSAEFTLSTGGVITGRIVDAESSAPLPGKGVTFSSEFIFERHTVESDAEGFFFVSAVRPGVYVASLADKELVITPESGTIGVQASGADAELKVVRGGDITGRVIQSETGEGIGNASVTAQLGRDRVNIRRAQTDASGTYRFTGLPPGAYAIALQSVRGFSHLQQNGESQTRRVSVAVRDTVSGVDFTVKRGLRISGTFVDESGQPVPQVAVTGYTDGGGITSYSFSDARGTFVLGGFEPDVDARLDIENQELALLKSPLPDMTLQLADADVTGLRFVLGVPSSISGIVVDEQGRPRKYVHVSARDPSDRSRNGSGANSDARGEFTFDSLSPGSYVLQFSNEKAKLPESEAPVIAVARGEKATGVRMIYRGGGAFTINGRVIDVRGLPMYGATIEVENKGHYATTDTAGQFKLEGMTEGTYTLKAYTDSRSASQTATAGDTGVVITLKDLATISGQVVDMVTNQPVPIFTINGIMVRDAEGRFEITNLGEGTTRIGVIAEGYANAAFTMPPVQAGEQRRDVMVRLEPGVQLSGRVIDAAGKSIAGAQVTAEVAKSAIAGTTRFSPLRTTSLADGQFSLGPLPARPVTVRASYKGYRNASTDVTLVHGGANRADLTLTLGAAIEGLVTLNGRPVARASVQADPEAGGSGSDARTDAQGRYRITGLNDGAYQVTASLQNTSPTEWRTKTVAAAISGTASVTTNFAFTVKGGSISGRVYRSGSEGLRDAQLQLESELSDGTREFMRTKTNDNGEYAFTGVSAGSVRLQLYSDDINRRAQFTMAAGEHVRKDFHLDRGTKIHVELTGGAASRADNLIAVLYETEVSILELSEAALEPFEHMVLVTGGPENGRIELGPVESGRYTLLVAAGDLSEANPDGTYAADWTVQTVEIGEGDDGIVTVRVNL